MTEPDQSPVDVIAIAHAAVLQINRRIYRALAQRGWRIELVIPDRLTWTSEPYSVEPDHLADPPIHRLPVKSGNFRTWSFEGLTALLAARRPRLVYLENEPDSTMATTVGRWCVRNRAQLIVNTTENDIPPVLAALVRRGLKPALRSLRTRLWMSLTRRYVAHVVAISEGGREAMAAIGFGDAVTVTPLGFDQTLFHPDPARRGAVRARLGLEGIAIAYFGRLVPEKGIHLLIEALGRLKHLQWQFLIDDLDAASSAYARELREAIRAAGIEQRTLTFTATHEEMPDFMRAADIVVVPSIWREQYGRVAPEAMACGCAVVVSDIGALPELVGGAGVKVPAGEVPALAAVLSDLIADPEQRRSLGTAAAERARTQLSLERQAALLDQLFCRLLGDAPSARRVSR